MGGERGVRDRGKGKHSGRNWEECLGNQRQMLGINDTQMARASCPVLEKQRQLPPYSFQQLKAELMREDPTRREVSDINL